MVTADQISLRELREKVQKSYEFDGLGEGCHGQSHFSLPRDGLLALVAAVEAARAFRDEHPGWSQDNFDEDSILEALQGGDSPGAQLDAALARFKDYGETT